MDKCKVIYRPFTSEYLQSFNDNVLTWTDNIYHSYLFVNKKEFRIAIDLCGKDSGHESLFEIKTVYYNG